MNSPQSSSWRGYEDYALGREYGSSLDPLFDDELLYKHGWMQAKQELEHVETSAAWEDDY